MLAFLRCIILRQRAVNPRGHSGIANQLAYTFIGGVIVVVTLLNLPNCLVYAIEQVCEI